MLLVAVGMLYLPAHFLSHNVVISTVRGAVTLMGHGQENKKEMNCHIQNAIIDEAVQVRY